MNLCGVFKLNEASETKEKGKKENKHAIHWIEIYPVNSVFRFLTSPSLEFGLLRVEESWTALRCLAF